MKESKVMTVGKPLIDWCQKVTDGFQEQVKERWTLKDVMRHHQEEILEFLEAYYTGNKEDIADEFWDCIFSFLTVGASDEFLSKVSPQSLETGFYRTINKINHRLETNHYKKLP